MNSELIKEAAVVQEPPDDKIIVFSRLPEQVLVDRENNRRTSVTFGSYTKSTILGYLKAPSTNEKNLRDACIYMYARSPQFARLVNYYGMEPLWAYTISTTQHSQARGELKKTFINQYLRAAAFIETMNLKHELTKLSIPVWREGVFYGIVVSDSTSWFIQRINPDYCTITSVVDGVYNFSIDMSRITENDLIYYSDVVAKMFQEYQSTGVRLQPVPTEVSWCVKVPETLSYNMPPFASTLPKLFDMVEYEDLQKERTEIGNYKGIHAQIPTNEMGIPTLDEGLITKYFTQLANNVPECIGIMTSPFKLTEFDFQRSGNLEDTDIVTRAEEQFWNASGTSSLLFGSSKNDSSSAMKLSVAADESLMNSMIIQCERLVNRYLKLNSATSKFKVSILPITRHNKDDYISNLKEAATYGMPVRSAYFAALGYTPLDVMTMNRIEIDILEMDKLTPLSSTHTQSASSGSDTGGRPSMGDDVGEAGEATRQTDQDDNKVVS